MKLSAIVITKNAAGKFPAWLKSLKFSDQTTGGYGGSPAKTIRIQNCLSAESGGMA